MGSFDPHTHGHTSIAQAIIETHNARIGVAMNAGKSPLFSLPERLAISRREVSTLGIDSLAVNLIPGSVARYAKRHGIDQVFRGQRNIVDEVSEDTLTHFYTQENPSLQVHTLASEI